MIRGQQPRPTVVALVSAGTLVSVAAVVTASAVAHWSSTGSANGSAPTSTLTDLTTTASTPSNTVLVPGGSAPLVITVTNPNPMPVVVTRMQLDPDRDVVVAGSVGTCLSPPFTVDATTTLSLPADSTTTVTVPAAVTLGSSAASGCQGATFTVPVTLSGGTS